MVQSAGAHADTQEDTRRVLPDEPAARIAWDSYWRSKRDFVDPMRDKWAEWRNLYRCYVEITDDDLVSKVFVPLIFSHVESFIPRLVANRPRIEVWGRGPEDDKRASLHRALQFYWWDKLRMSMFLVGFAKTAEVEGVAWAKLSYRKVVSDKKVRVLKSRQRRFFNLPIPGTGEASFEIEEREVTEWDDPHVIHPYNDEIFPDPSGRDEMDCEYICHEMQPESIEDLKAARHPDGGPLYRKDVISELEKMAKEANRATEHSNDSSLQERTRNIFGPEAEPSPDPHKRQWTLIEYWTDDKVVTIVKEAPGLDAIRNEIHGLRRKPFRRFTPIPVANELCGIAIPQILAYLNMEINTLHGARVDNVLQSVHRLISVMRNANVNPRALRARPGGFVWVDSHDDFQEREIPSANIALHREEEQSRLWSQLATGATDPFMGISSGFGGGTATEAAAMQAASGSRVGLMFQILSDQFLKEFGRDLIFMAETHISDRRRLRIAGDDFDDSEFIDLKPEDLHGGSGVDLDIVMDIAATEPATRQFKLNQAIQALSTLAQLFPPEHPVMERFTAQLMRGLGIENPENMIAQGRQMLAAAREAGQEPGSGPPPESSGVATRGDQLAVEAAAAEGQNA